MHFLGWSKIVSGMINQLHKEIGEINTEEYIFPDFCFTFPLFSPPNKLLLLVYMGNSVGFMTHTKVRNSYQILTHVIYHSANLACFWRHIFLCIVQPTFKSFKQMYQFPRRLCPHLADFIISKSEICPQEIKMATNFTTFQTICHPHLSATAFFQYLKRELKLIDEWHYVEI